MFTKSWTDPRRDFAAIYSVQPIFRCIGDSLPTPACSGATGRHIADLSQGRRRSGTMSHLSTVAAMDSEAIWPRQRVVGLQNLAHRLNHNSLTRPAARIIELVIRLVFSAALPADARIHRSVHFAHNAMAVVLNPLVVIEENCHVGSHVVMGGKYPVMGAPHIASGVTIHAGAKLIGAITIGEGCVIGANAVVVKDVPPHCVVVGVPGEVIKQGIDPADYRPPAKAARAAHG